MTKNLFMIGGPNGAGKTTSAFSLMPELLICEEYVNADAIAASLSPFKPDSIAIQAGRIMLNRIKHLATESKNFAFETTMSSKSFIKLLNACKQDGYQINLLYIWINSPELAISRVKSRVEKGGHRIPDEVVKRRYTRSMYNLTNIYIPLADRWAIFDNTSTQPQIIAEKFKHDNIIQVTNQNQWKIFKELLNEK